MPRFYYNQFNLFEKVANAKIKMSYIPLITNIAGALIGVALIIINLRFSHTLIGSILKNYYQWLIVGSTLFTLGFLAEALELTGFYPEIAEIAHHLLIISSVITFVIISIRLPREASKCISDHTAKTQ